MLANRTETRKEMYVDEFGYIVQVYQVESNGFSSIEKKKYKVEFKTGLLVETRESSYQPPEVVRNGLTTKVNVVKVPPLDSDATHENFNPHT